MDATNIQITKRGNALGFTAAGETVCGEYRAGAKAWRIWVDGILALNDPRTCSFANLGEARAYAATLIDDEATDRLAWW